MKLLTKCTGYHNYLVYLKDDNDNSLEAYEFTGDYAYEEKEQKEADLCAKYNIIPKDYKFVNLEEFMLEQCKDDTKYEAPKDYPLILVFYLDRELMENKQILIPYAQSVNDNIAARKANIMVYFIPTDGEERIECINPRQVSPADMEKINAMVEEIAIKFDVAQPTGLTGSLGYDEGTHPGP